VRRTALCAALDIAVIAVFVGIGRSVHGHLVDAAGMFSTAWPFLAGAGVGWLASRAWRRPAGAKAGIAVWLCTVAVGMVLRVLAGQGIAFAFVLVALGFLGGAMLGWRLIGAAAAAALRRVPETT
jgi:hypothetical protein